jgi:hypothetical protein
MIKEERGQGASKNRKETLRKKRCEGEAGNTFGCCLVYR